MSNACLVGSFFLDPTALSVFDSSRAFSHLISHCVYKIFDMLVWFPFASLLFTMRHSHSNSLHPNARSRLQNLVVPQCHCHRSNQHITVRMSIFHIPIKVCIVVMLALWQTDSIRSKPLLEFKVAGSGRIHFSSWLFWRKPVTYSA